MKNANVLRTTLSGLFLCLFISSTFAVELTDVTGPTINVDEGSDLPDNNLSDGICRTSEGGCSLRAAIQESNEDTDRIRLIQLFAGVMTSDSKEDYDISSSVVIRGSLDTNSNITSAISGTPFSRIFNILRDSVKTTEVLIKDLQLQDGPALYNGGIPEKNGSIIFSRGNLTLDNVTIIRGGKESNAIFSEGGTLEFINSRKLGNGRAIAIELGTVTINNSRFEQGDVKTGGAAIQNQGGTVGISDSIFVGNRADTASPSQGRGGAIQNLSGTMIIEDSQFSANQGVLGGAIYSAATLIIKNGVTFGGNLATRASAQDPTKPGISDGGALYLAAGQAFVRDAAFTNNKAERNGGAIYVASAANAKLQRLNIRFNDAFFGGGGVFFEPTSTGSTIQQSQILKNTVGNVETSKGGGGLTLSGGVTVSELLISENSAFSGAGVAVSGDGNAIENSTIVLNNTGFITDREGAVFGSDAGIIFDSSDATHELKLTHVTLAGNTSKKESTAGLTAKTGSIVLKNTVVLQPAPDTVLCSGSIVSAGNNVSGDATCNLTQSSDKPNEVDEFVIALANNGGISQTTALPSGSVAIDLVPGEECLATDQRLFGRDTANRCDAGAFETGAIALGNGGELNFVTTNFPRSETDGFITLSVERTGGSAGAVSVEVVDLLAGDASLNDYKYSQQTLSWLDGDSTAKTFTVEIIDDGNKESNSAEKVFFSLLNNTGSASIGDRDIATLSIQDNDTIAFGEYKLAKPAYTSPEVFRDDSPNTGENGERVAKSGSVDIEIQRVGPADLAATLRYRTIDGTAVAGEDYIALDALQTFSPEETSKFVTVTLIDDTDFEADESFFFEISSDPSLPEVFFSTPTRATITISSEDAEPIDTGPPKRDRLRGATGAINPFVLLLFWGVMLLRYRFRPAD